MNVPTRILVRVCPSCGDERPPDEFVCGNEVDGAPCHWPLADEEIREAGASSAPSVEPATAPPPRPRTCVNGHPLEAGDEMCLECGGDPAPVGAFEPQANQDFDRPHSLGADDGHAAVEALETLPSPTLVDGWEFLARVPYGSTDAAWERFEVVRPTDGRRAWLTLYREGREPDAAVHEALRRVSREHVPELLATGRHDRRAYEVSELIEGGSLADVGWSLAEGDGLRRVVEEMVDALDGLAEIGLRHRDLRPTNVLIRTRDPLDLVVTGFGSARLSDFDLEAVAPLELTRYSAPEAIVGAVSAASDWWSLGMIALELATAGSCFRGVDDQALRLHVVTRGMLLPKDLTDEVRTLLRGLLARDPSKRWTATEVRSWLSGASVSAPDEVGVEDEGSGPSLGLAGRRHTRPEAYALAAAQADVWEEARGLTLGGALATWLGQRDAAPRVVAQVRTVAADEDLSDDLRHAVALMAINPNLPLTLAGRIVTPAWLLERPDEGYALVTGQTVSHLERMGREPWLTRMRSRVDAVRERARLLEVELDEERVRVALLSTSRANLEAERNALRRIYPDSDHSGLGSLVDRAKLTDEDLVLLIGAAAHQFVPLATLADSAKEVASRAGVTLDEASLTALLTRPRREVLAAVEERTTNFARCGIPRVDEWADAFRTERRIALPHAAALLAVPAEAWREPPKQQYVADLLGAFEKRLAGAVGRGPLARFTLGKTTPRLDLAELGTALRPAEDLLAHVLGRVEASASVDPGAFLDDEGREVRLRRLVSHAETFRRDTGIDGRYLGFPFVVSRDARSSSRPRLLPILLWPVVLELASGAGGRATLAFDRGREEVRLNPALEVLLGGDAFARWRVTRDEVLGRPAIRPADVVDAFGAHAHPRGRKLVPLPRDVSVPPGSLAIVPSAALFNAEFLGQAVAEDLRQMRRRSLAGTALEVAIRVASKADGDPRSAPAERDRFLTVASDPSQESAVMRSREAPGLLVEGPPGTGKSQTIVNMLADAIGRGETVLVVCQKLAALQVVQKRMAAEGLGNRLALVTDVNRDREPLVRSIRDQLAEARSSTSGKAAAIRRSREERAAQIEVVEGELDRRHEALHALDDVTGMSYRDVLGELIAVEGEGPIADAPGLRRVTARLDRGGLARLEQTCAPLARTWLESRYEGSPLGVLRPFSVDASVRAELEADLLAFSAEDANRSEVIARCSTAFEMTDPAAYRAWLDRIAGPLEAMADDVRQRLGAWVDLFRPEAGRHTAGSELIASLRSLEVSAHGLVAGHDDPLFRACSALSPGDLDRLAGDVAVASSHASFWRRLSPSRRARVRRVDGFLTAADQPVGTPGYPVLRDALALEASSRPLRAALADVQAALGYKAETKPLPLARLREVVGGLVDALEEVEAPATSFHACPPGYDAVRIAREGSRAAVDRMRRAFEDSFARREAVGRCEAALARLSDWFDDDWTATCRSRVAGDIGTADVVGPILGALDALSAFQRFRARVGDLDASSLAAFSVLRGCEARLRGVPADALEGLVRRTLRREGLLAWKSRLESAHPELTFERGEVERKVALLAGLSDEMRDLNRQFLAVGVDPSKLAKASAWEDVTRLRGPRTRRLREILELGPDLGLMHLRPVWLMSPDVASRLLPLKAAAFDLVVYDEASQMPVEHAVPTLYRGRRVVVSGDEKQMPPSNFFTGRVEEEDARDDEEPDDAATETERAAHEEAWNRRDVQACPDLLQLARTCLPTTTLQIHYRSKYRELIAFSNAAFYGGQLSVPARHPDDEVRRARPVEVLRVDGIYEGQTNLAEAERVVDVLADIWAAPPDQRPSVGVVTFNRKQADLVEDVIERRAGEDAGFLEALKRERDRIQGGEDMGYFTKNVENVQGDERDVIVFSTTFGRDRNGAFRRTFGVLGQVGGERRLNVAMTRARDKVVLVTSMPLRDVSDWLASGRAPDKPRDYLQAYLDHAERLSRGDLEGARAMQGRLGARAARRPERDDPRDGFVRSVEAFLVELGHRPVRASDGEDAFAFDFAVEDPRTGLFGIGIECDAPRHPLLARARAREVWRPKVLGRAVPRVHRIASADWYADGAAERARLAEAIRRAMQQELAS